MYFILTRDDKRGVYGPDGIHCNLRDCHCGILTLTEKHVFAGGNSCLVCTTVANPDPSVFLEQDPDPDPG